jgi:predicted O-methyltransferase YrrM
MPVHSRKCELNSIVFGRLRRIKEEPFDLIYVDARKSEYIEYVKIVLERNLLAPKGIMLVDDSRYFLLL